MHELEEWDNIYEPACLIKAAAHETRQEGHEAIQIILDQSYRKIHIC